MKLEKWVAASIVVILLVGVMSAALDCAQAQQVSIQENKAACPHLEKWQPTAEELKRILARHHGWLALKSGKLLDHDALLERLEPLDLDWRLEAQEHPEQGNLCNADLTEATLTRADLREATLTNAKLLYADLTQAIYTPISPSPDPYAVAGIKGLETVKFTQGEEVGLVQLRDLLQKAGLRDLEREATYAIEHGRTQHVIQKWTGDWSRVWNDFTSQDVDLDKVIKELNILKTHTPATLEGFFRIIAFDWTTAYGLYPGYALLFIVGLWILFILIYIWPICRPPRSAAKPSGIYRVFPGDRIARKPSEIKPTLEKEASIERLQRHGWAALGYATYFSLLSAFNIGFRELNVGNWIARLQMHEYTLRPVGWVRSVSGVQSLLSVYLLAIWALTYFGRPFQ